MKTDTAETIDHERLAAVCGGSRTNRNGGTRTKWLPVHNAPRGASEVFCNRGGNPFVCTVIAPGLPIDDGP